MDIRELLTHFEALARINDAGSLPSANYAPSRSRANDLREWTAEFREMLEHQQREATEQRAGIDLATVSVIHAIEIGLEETAKAHAYVEAARQEAIERTNEAMRKIADEKRSKVALAFLHTIEQQIATLPEVRAMARAADGTYTDEVPSDAPWSTRVLRKLAENIANNLAVYAVIPDQCEVCGQISAGNTCCPPPKGFNDVDEDGVPLHPNVIDAIAKGGR